MDSIEVLVLVQYVALALVVILLNWYLVMEVVVVAVREEVEVDKKNKTYFDNHSK